MAWRAGAWRGARGLCKVVVGSGRWEANGGRGGWAGGLGSLDADEGGDEGGVC